jgi:hypothetical protein
MGYPVKLWRRWVGFLAVSLLPWAPGAAAGAPDQAKDANALLEETLLKAARADAGKRGLNVAAMLPPLDIDNDGKLEIVAAAAPEDPVEFVLVVWRATGNKVAHAWQSEPTGADAYKRLVFWNMVEEKRPEIVLELVEHTPDETLNQLRVYRAQPGGITQVLRIAVPVVKPEKQPGRITYGDETPGYRVEDVDNDGNKEVLVKREPRTLVVKTRHDETRTLVLGVKENVFRWDRASGAYAPGPDRFENFLLARKPKQVLASSQKLPPEAKPAEPKTMDVSLDDVSGAVGDGKAPAAPPPDKKEEPAPMAIWGADNNLDTAWVENAAGPGEGEWVQLEFGESVPVRMVRVVPVCAKDEETMASHNELTAFSIYFAGSPRVSVDRKEKVPGDMGVLAVVEAPSPERKFAPQVLVFLTPGTESSMVRVMIDKVKKRGKANDTCVAEVSVH